jgi:hypothetical protein
MTLSLELSLIYVKHTTCVLVPILVLNKYIFIGNISVSSKIGNETLLLCYVPLISLVWNAKDFLQNGQEKNKLPESCCIKIEDNKEQPMIAMTVIQNPNP